MSSLALLAAITVDHAIHALPITVKSLPPVYIKHVMEGPDPWLAFYAAMAVAGIPALLGLYTVIAAVLTLVMVNQQIRIANKQLTVANDELTAVKNDFELAQKQFREFMRRPRVTVTLSVRTATIIDNAFDVTFALSNRGSTLSREVMVELLIPFAHFRETSPTDRVYHMPTLGETVAKGRPYRSVSVRGQNPIYPNGVLTHYNFPGIRLAQGIRRTRMLFRAYDERYAYPDDYGVLDYDMDSQPDASITVGAGPPPLEVGQL